MTKKRVHWIKPEDSGITTHCHYYSRLVLVNTDFNKVTCKICQRNYLRTEMNNDAIKRIGWGNYPELAVKLYKDRRNIV